MSITAKLVDAGIDYVRVTSQDQRQKGKMLDYYLKKRAGDEALGYKESKGGAFGFVGYKIRHALYGVKGEWAMVQVSGARAKDSLVLCKTGTQCTRLDLQVTYHVGEQNVGKVLRQAYEDACSHVRPKARPVAVKLIEERHQAQTVYVGKRASDIFIRCYDKFEESAAEEFRGCVRFEVELKGRAAKSMWAGVQAGQGWISLLLKQLYEILKERGIVLPDDDFSSYPTIPLKKERTSDESKLAWLHRAVRPTVAHLAAIWGFHAPFAQLFADTLDSRRFHRVQSLYALN
jgi:DNA relaxase NicK